MADANIVDTLAQEIASSGQTSRGPNLPSIPVPVATVDSLLRSVLAMKQILEAREAVSGSVMDKSLTMRDLLDAGAMQLQLGGRTLGGAVSGGPVIFSANPGTKTNSGTTVGFVDPRPYLEVPPTLTNFTVTGGFSQVFIDWRMAEYKNHRYVEVYRADSNSRGAAILIGVTTTNFYIDKSAGLNSTYYYWARAVGILESGVTVYGPDNAVNGTAGGRLLVSGVDFGPLLIEAEDLANGAVTGTKIAANTIVAGNMAANSIAANNIIARTITGDKLAFNSILSEHIQVGTLQGDRITSNSMHADRLTAGTITSTQIAAGGISADRIDARGLTIRDASGNIIVNAGTGAFSGTVTGNVTGSVNGVPAATLTLKADLAKAAADTAQQQADYAVAALSEIASDNILTAGEKPQVIQIRDQILAERTSLLQQADLFGITTDKTNYDNSVTALTSYLATLTTPFLWSDLSGSTNIDGPTFRSKFNDVALWRQNLFNQIARANKLIADTANSGLGLRLRNDSQNILAAGAGLSTGNLTWNPVNGVITGGAGVAMNGRGITAFNGSVSTFAIDGATGNATFAGQLAAASGTFAGSLTAASGTFSGTLTADNIITTGNMKGQAVTMVYGATAYFSASVSLTFTILPSDIPVGQTGVPVIVIGSQDVTASTFFDLGGSGPGFPMSLSGPGNLIAAQPPQGGVFSMSQSVTLGVGTWTAYCYDHGGLASQTRVRTVVVMVGKR